MRKSKSSSSLILHLHKNKISNQDAIHFKEFYTIIPNIITITYWVLGISIILSLLFFFLAFCHKKKLPRPFKKIDESEISSCENVSELLYLQPYINYKILELIFSSFSIYVFVFNIGLEVYKQSINPIVYDSFTHSHSTAMSALNGSFIMIIGVFFLKKFIQNFWNFFKSLLQDNGYYPAVTIEDWLARKNVIRNRILELKKKDSELYHFERNINKKYFMNTYPFTNVEKAKDLRNENVKAIYYMDSQNLYIRTISSVENFDIKDSKDVKLFKFILDGKKCDVSQINNLKDVGGGTWQVIFNGKQLMKRKITTKKEKKNLFNLIERLNEISLKNKSK